MKKTGLVLGLALLAMAGASCKKIGGGTPQMSTDSVLIGLAAYYPLDGSSVDVSGNNNHGVGTNVIGTADRAGRANRALYFNGYNANIVVGDNHLLRLDSADFSISVWAKLDRYDDSYGTDIVCKRLTGADNGWSFSVTGTAFQNSGQGPIGSLSFSNGKNNNVASYIVPLNTWVMLTTVYRVATRQLSYYVNAQLVQTLDNVAPPNANVNPNMYIGSDNPLVPSTGYFLKGTLDELYIYNRALSNKGIQELYKLPLK